MQNDQSAQCKLCCRSQQYIHSLHVLSWHIAKGYLCDLQRTVFPLFPVELVNNQLALEGIEHKGFVVASSYVAQVFGCEHEPRLREGDLVNKKSWIFKLQDVQVSAGAPCVFL